ncbi:MAG TPA: hypothetical protein VHC90_11480, partial [Bryobacteraceae bacterium]|nr:hypothetical protein [Bryobacteraceae bacterium]
MSVIRNLVLEEFSIVRGDDVQPANPGAVALVYKAHPKPKEKEAVAKPAAGTAAPVNKKTPAAVIMKAVKEAIAKAKTTYTSNSTSTYESSSTVEEEPDNPTGADDQPIVIVVQDSVEKTEPAPAAAPPANDGAEVISKAVQAALAPFVEQVTKMGDRLATIEKQSTGSRQITKYVPNAPGGENVETKFGEFTEFLRSKSGLTAGQKLTKTTLSSSGWTYGLSYVEAGTFIDYIVDQSVVLKQCRTI